jgi:hypothetical protein
MPGANEETAITATCNRVSGWLKPVESVRHDAEDRAEQANDSEDAGQDQADNPAEIRTLACNDHVHPALDPFQTAIEAIHPTVEAIHPAVEAVHTLVKAVHTLIEPLQTYGGCASDLFEHCNPAFHIGRIPAAIAWFNRNIKHDATPFGMTATTPVTRE